MAMRRRAFRGRARNPILRRWAGQIVSTTVLSGAQHQTTLVVPATYRLGTSLEPSGPTLVRIRGSVTMFPASTASGQLHPLWAGIVVHDADFSATNAAPNNASHLTEEEWLWTKTGSFAALTQLTGMQPLTWEFDVKAKRRLRDSVVSFMLINANVSHNLEIHGQFRSLLIGG